MNSLRITSPRTLTLLKALTLLLGIGLVALYGWLVVVQPAAADQLTAVLMIGLNILLVLYDPMAGFLMWIFVVPFAKFLPFDLHMPAGVPDLSFSRVVGGFLVLYLLAQTARRRYRLPNLTALELVIPFYVIALGIAAARSMFGWLTGFQAVLDSYIMPLLAYFIARYLLANKRDYRSLGNVLILMAVILAVLATLEQLFGIQLFRTETTADYYTRGIRKVGALLGNPAYIALAINVTLPMVLLRIIQATRPRTRWFYVGIFLLLETGIFLTYNRSGYLGSLLVLLVLALLNGRLRRYVIPLLLVGGLVAFFSWNAIQNSNAGTRLTAESPVDYRLQAIQIGLEIHREQPIFGAGLGSFGRLAARRGFDIGHAFVLPTPHNTYLDMLVSGGYVLLGTYLLLAAALALTLFRQGLRFRRRLRATPLYLQAAWASMFAYYIPTATFDIAFSYYSNMIFWTIMGAVITRSMLDTPEAVQDAV